MLENKLLARGRLFNSVWNFELVLIADVNWIVCDNCVNP